jgi:hypothetical protein
LDFANDIAISSSTQRQIQMKTKQKLEQTTAKRIGLKINANTSKIMRNNPKQEQPIKINNT